jgi:phage gp36-like protein
VAYVDQEALVTRFGEDELQALAPDGNGGIDTETVLRACDDAAGEVDSRLAAAGLPTPMTPVPAVVAAVAADIARYRLYDEHASDAVTKRYDDAMKFLRDLARGDVKLGQAATESPSSAGDVQFNSSRRVFPGGGF